MLLRLSAWLVPGTGRRERAIFLLALAGPDGLHLERLAELLWSCPPTDRQRLLGRIRTLAWDIRRGLGTHAWRLERHGPILRLDLSGADFDLVRTRAAARAAIAIRPSTPPTGVARLARQLRRPVLTRWAFEDWVIHENEANQLLARKLTQPSVSRYPGAPTRRG